MNRASLAITVLTIQAFALGAPRAALAEDDVVSAESKAEAPIVVQTASIEPVVDDGRVTSTVRAVRRARSSTVNIHSEKRAASAGDAIFQSGRDRKVNGMGTGIVVDERGYIVTNHHVVAEVDTLRVTLFDGTAYKARVVSYDRLQDLAIIKIDPARTLETMPLGTSSDLMLGEDVIAIGNSFGYEHTITRGIISSLSRDVEVNAEQAYNNLIQTDTAINPGNSGGPLINRVGDVIGINVAIRAGAQKIGFAIPIDDARRVIARLMSVEQLDKRYHGLTLEDRKSGASRQLIVSRVTPGSPAANAGIKSGDIISTVNGTETVDSADFERMLLGRTIGTTFPVALLRNGETEELAMTLATLDRRRSMSAYQSIDKISTTPVSVKKPVTASADPAWDVFGVRLQPVGPDATRGTKYRGGMRVTGVKPAGPAYREHVRTGDILVGLSSWEVINETHINYVLRKTREQPKEKVRFYIVRKGETLFGDFKLASTL